MSDPKQCQSPTSSSEVTDQQMVGDVVCNYVASPGATQSCSNFASSWAALGVSAKPSSSATPSPSSPLVYAQSPLCIEFDNLFSDPKPLDTVGRFRKEVDVYEYSKAVSTFTVFKGYPHKRAAPFSPEKPKRPRDDSC